jgi:UTP--glucose-1-phosphate uridylyltransferase
MDSFNTHDETLKVISKYHNVKARIESFNQSRFPRIVKDSMLPLPEDHVGHKDDWFPPGHGDVYRAFANSGLLDKLIEEGKEYVFISNIDNLGATVDFRILNWMDQNKSDFIMEVTDKTRADVKGGTLIDYDGKPKLFEIAQCPSDKVDEFKSIKKFKIFNTNNLWVSLKAIKEFVSSGKDKGMDVIINPKKARGKEILQLETACGAAIEFFNNARGVNVDRRRFLPVKSTSDLFVVQSNLYELENATLIMNPKRAFPSVPLVKLGDHFKTVGDYAARFKTIPDILELDQLTVSGDVTFGAKVSLRGTVIIVANQGSRIDIPDGAVLENKVISGNLRILEH